MRLQMLLDQVAFAAMGGVKKNSQIAYESGKTAPSVDYLLALEQHGIDIGYILTGRQYDSDLSLEQQLLFEMFERLSSREREAIMSMMSVLSGQAISMSQISSQASTGKASAQLLQQGRAQFGDAPTTSVEGDQ